MAVSLPLKIDDRRQIKGIILGEHTDKLGGDEMVDALLGKPQCFEIQISILFMALRAGNGFFGQRFMQFGLGL